MDQEIKQDNIEKEITTEKEKDGVRNLHKKYKDMIGWLEIKDTGFSYPVMQTGIKGHHEGDWQYYLHRDVHGDYSFYGTDRKSTRLNSSHPPESRMPSSA